MKKFFKKIGRGIKKIASKIGDFFDSKIGRIIGGVMLAVALPHLFSSFMTGGVTTGARATTQTHMFKGKGMALRKGAEKTLVAQAKGAGDAAKNKTA